MNALSFTARIYKLGINPCVDVPAEAAHFFKRRGFVPIVGLVNGKTYRATLVPRGDGLHRLYLNEPIRKATKTDVGSDVRFELKLDRTSRVIKTPSEFASALKAQPAAQTAFRRGDSVPPPRIAPLDNWRETPGDAAVPHPAHHRQPREPQIETAATFRSPPSVSPSVIAVTISWRFPFLRAPCACLRAPFSSHRISSAAPA